MADDAPGLTEEARAWLDRAELDLTSAQLIRDGDGPSTVACFPR